MVSESTPGRPIGDTIVDEGLASRSQTAAPWVTVVWDDPVNLMSYVVHVFTAYFNYPRERAERLMLQVHTEGKAIVSAGGREAMERDVEAMHSYGLWATLDRSS